MLRGDQNQSLTLEYGAVLFPTLLENRRDGPEPPPNLLEPPLPRPRDPVGFRLDLMRSSSDISRPPAIFAGDFSLLPIWGEGS